MFALDGKSFLIALILRAENLRAEACFDFLCQHRSLVPIERASLPCVKQPDAKNRDEDERLDEAEHSQVAQLDRPRIQKNHLDVEQQKKYRRQIETHRE